MRAACAVGKCWRQHKRQLPLEVRQPFIATLGALQRCLLPDGALTLSDQVDAVHPDMKSLVGLFVNLANRTREPECGTHTVQLDPCETFESLPIRRSEVLLSCDDMVTAATCEVISSLSPSAPKLVPSNSITASDVHLAAV